MPGTVTGRQMKPHTWASARWELLRSLGAALVTPPPENARVLGALGLPAQTSVEHTDVFVLSAPPHAAIHLGPEGKLGGEGLDRVVGFWRALGLRPPEDADHLGVLLMLYAEMGEAESRTATERVHGWMRRARTVLLHEHISCWVPGYLASVTTLGVDSVTSWADLVRDTLREELSGLAAPGALPLALREAPSALSADIAADELIDCLVTPVRAGFVLTRRDVSACAASIGVGLRRGERRFVLKAMMEQDPAAATRWLAAHARHWSKLHTSDVVDEVTTWWSRRAADSADALAALTTPASHPIPAGSP
jgi:TorA maturation chaperone TorD